MGSWDEVGLGTGIAPPRPTPVYPPGTHPLPTPGTPSRLHVRHRVRGACYSRVNMAVGLRSVVQLTLSAEISDIRGMTEVYNLAGIGRNNNHSFIPGTN